MWWSRCAQKRMLEPTSSDTLLALSWEPSLDLALSSVMLRLRPMLMPTPSSLESSALLTTPLPLLATLLALLDLLPLQLPQLLLAMLLPLLLLAMLLHLHLLLQLLLHLLLLLR